MGKVSLTIKDKGLGYGIFPNPDTPLEKHLEMRARTVLAYAYVNELIKPHVVDLDEGAKLVLLDTDPCEVFEDGDYAWTLRNDVNTGYIAVTDAQTLNWDDQPGRMILYVARDVTIDIALASYFASCIKWLDDNQRAKELVVKAVKRAMDA